ncbi:TOMM precursor leader peptide-binding protein [Streptomyces sp. NPDC127084]|uniref:TOMM precursor leader peptide-binding protein n=1 Tax=Streptomyces sp. NPDC127084 TaxID=3347133 RepID=UPI00365EB03E
MLHKDDTLLSAHAAATVHMTLSEVLVGPWGGGCGNCLAMRWQRLRSHVERDALEAGAGPRGSEGPPLVTDFLADVVWAHHEAGSRQGRRQALPQVTAVDITTLLSRTVALLPEPLCPTCGPVETDNAERAALHLVSCPKPAPSSYRLRTPHAFNLPETALANPVCGAVTSTTHADLMSYNGSPVSGSAAVRIATEGLVDISFHGHTDSYATSRAVAFIEGLERYAGLNRGRNAPFVTDTYANRGDHALDPRARGVYRPEVYRHNQKLTPFDPDLPIPWVWGYSLRDERPLLIPARSVYYGSGTARENFVYESSNGSASGSCLEEAILFGLLELIERDAFLLAWYGGVPLTEIDLTYHRSPATRALIERISLSGHNVRVFDNRLDMDVPAVTAVAIRRDGGAGLLSFAAGASLDAAAAVHAAVSELAAVVPSLARRVNNRRAQLTEMADDFMKVQVLADHAELYGLPRMAQWASRYTGPSHAVPYAEIYAGWQARRPASTDLLHDLAHCREQIVAAGHDVIVVETTTPEQLACGLRCVATIAPGMLPLDFGWEKQRALDLPRLTSRFHKDRLHLAPHPFP